MTQKLSIHEDFINSNDFVPNFIAALKSATTDAIDSCILFKKILRDTNRFHLTFVFPNHILNSLESFDLSHDKYVDIRYALVNFNDI